MWLTVRGVCVICGGSRVVEVVVAEVRLWWRWAGTPSYADARTLGGHEACGVSG